MKLHLSDRPGTGDMHMLHVHKAPVYPAHWLQQHSALVSLLVAIVIALLFIWMAFMISANSVPPQLKRINNGAWYLFSY